MIDTTTLTVEAGGSMFVTRSASEWIDSAAAIPVPECLWKSLWFENELAALFADTNMGKSIYAVQIGNHIARQGRRVLYFDFEMSEKQFFMRYVDADTGHRFPFSPDFLRSELRRDIRTTADIAPFIRDIGAEAHHHNAKVLIIDNISWLTNQAESGDVAGELMQALVKLKRDNGLSILVIGHTPKRDLAAPLTQNTLSGSKRIANFLDAMFAIGPDRSRPPHGRYVKQIKVRSSEMEYGADNVICYNLERTSSGAVEFVETGHANEAAMLRSDELTQAGVADRRRRTPAEAERQRHEILALHSRGETQQSIARIVRCSLRHVSEVLRRGADPADVNAEAPSGTDYPITALPQ